MLIEIILNVMINKKICIIVPVYNEQFNIKKIISEIEKTIKKIKYKFDILFVDDGSNDNTFKILNSLSLKKKNVKVLKFNKNYGKESALAAGMNFASNYEAAITLDSDLQHPPILITKLFKEWKKGHPMVLFIRIENKGSSKIRHLFSIMFYKFINFFLNFENLKFNTDFRIYDKKIITEFNNAPVMNGLFRVRIDSLGFDYKILEFSAPKRLHGDSNYSLYKLIKIAVLSIFDFSMKPLKIIVIFSSLFFLASSFFLFFLLVDYFFLNYLSILPRTIIASFNLFITSINFLVLGTVCIYLNSIKNLISVKKIYNIERKLNID